MSPYFGYPIVTNRFPLVNRCDFAPVTSWLRADYNKSGKEGLILPYLLHGEVRQYAEIPLPIPQEAHKRASRP